MLGYLLCNRYNLPANDPAIEAIKDSPVIPMPLVNLLCGGHSIAIVRLLYAVGLVGHWCGMVAFPGSI